ncbi:hypothetical protein [Bradyrhizobium symbiodeficiens]|uniref:hypothetical protein n=1 Tax=Bradyrhizobium symbiodeficiens TaxID=1404367 RepID=UPI000BA1BE30|nr:hypothetical protein [Bradyrhizobium symbiodeficiens]AWM07633.1 hypothetical protein CIT39_15045 [Bradyrhizobium symbiodeficiens]
MEKAPITPRALIQRINRRLRPKHQRLRMFRGNSRWWNDLGDFYVVDLEANLILHSHVEPVAFGRELGVVQPFEEVVAEEVQ